jgi:hypothetical protein
VSNRSEFEVVDCRIAAPPPDRALPAAAAAIFAWLVARACLQSITIDEADTYLAFVGRRYPSQWEAAANNHVLNSLLMRLTTALFGVSHLSMRLPALAGAAVYLAAAVVLVRALATDRLLRWATFGCLTLNPFVMDHLVAARGYSLALGFLLAIPALAAMHHSDRPERCAAACSAAAALSFCANFSFAIAGAAVLALVTLWLALATPGWTARLRLSLAAILPGALLTLLIAGSVLLEWTKGGDLVWGAASLRESLWSVGRASLFQPNPYLLNPPLYRLAVHSAAVLFPALGVACVLRLATLLRHRGPSRALALAAISGGAALLALAAHYALFRKLHLLLPLDRTAVFFAPLGFLSVGAMAAVRFGSRAARLSRALTAGVLAAFAVYFVCCLRLSYFRTWQFDADMKHVYAVLSYYNHRRGIAEISANWRYVAALNYYRAASGRESLDEVPPGPAAVAEYPPGQPIYVLYQPSDQPFIDREHLQVVYSDGDSGVAIALPQVAPHLQ